MSKAGKIITGILSFLPIVLFIAQFILFFVFFFNTFFQASIDPSAVAIEEEALVIPMIITFGLFMTASIIGLGMLIYLLFHANKNTRLNDDDRLMWIILLVVLGILVFPIYWYIGIWKNESIDLSKQ